MSRILDLYALKEFRFPIFAECINPDVIHGKSCKEIKMLKIWEGNKQKIVGDLFKVEEKSDREQEDTTVVIHGDVSRVRRIGAKMTSGNIIVKGDAGAHLGEEMNGGTITVHGNVGGWAGSMMKGGTIDIHGNAGNYLASPYRGISQGMRGGRIIVHGNVGNEAVSYMKKGLVKIYGKAGQFVGLRMHKGTIYIQKDCGQRAGAGMKNGKIIVGGFLESILPTFTIDSVKENVKVEGTEVAEGLFYRFLGDLTEKGKGKLYVCKKKNLHLSYYEELL